MRVLCCLDGTNSEQIQKAVHAFLTTEDLTVALLYVIDSGPHGEMERQRERFMRSQATGPRRDQMQQAEQDAARDILAEGARYFSNAETLQRAGRPEREIVNCAAEWHADIVVLCPRSPQLSKPQVGPKSIGHVARFVVDHAPCPVLLVRPLTHEQFPLPGK